MIRQVSNKPIASTRIDRQGEQLSLEMIQGIMRSMPDRIPLHKDHDMSLPVGGELYNFRIIQDPEDHNHHILLCDATYDDTITDFSTGGLSWSFTVPGLSNDSNPDTSLFLPYPYYNDAGLTQKLLEAEFPLHVGQWRKKATDPLAVALLMLPVALIANTAYKSYFESKLKAFIAYLLDKWPEDLSIAVSVSLQLNAYNPCPLAIFTPPKEAGVWGIATITEGIAVASDFCIAEYVHNNRKIRKITLVYDSGKNGYSIVHVDFLDNTSRNIQ